MAIEKFEDFLNEASAKYYNGERSKVGDIVVIYQTGDDDRDEEMHKGASVGTEFRVININKNGTIDVQDAEQDGPKYNFDSEILYTESVNEAKKNIKGKVLGSDFKIYSSDEGEHIILIVGDDSDQYEHPYYLKKNDTIDKLKKRFYQGKSITIPNPLANEENKEINESKFKKGDFVVLGAPHFVEEILDKEGVSLDYDDVYKVIKMTRGNKGMIVKSGQGEFIVPSKYMVMDESLVTEASRRKVYKAATQGSYPAVIVVIQDGKVIHQEPVSTPDVAPATFNVMQEKYPKAKLHLEDKTGRRLFSESYDLNEGTISGSKISMLGTKIFNKIEIGSKFNTDTNVYTVTDYGRKSNAFNEYIVTDKNGKEIGAKLSAMYSTTFELSSHPKSLVFSKQEMLNSITESVNQSGEGFRVEYKTQDGENAKSGIFKTKEEAETKEKELVNKSRIKQAKIVSVNEAKHTIKRKYGIYDARRINEKAPLRNSIIKYIGNNIMTEEQIKDMLIRVEEDLGKSVNQTRWFKSNMNYFKVSKNESGEKTYQLSKFGQRIFDNINQTKSKPNMKLVAESLDEFLNEKSQKSIKWDELSDDERESALLTAVKDPDNVEKYIDSEYNDLPPEVTQNLKFESVNEAWPLSEFEKRSNDWYKSFTEFLLKGDKYLGNMKVEDVKENFYGAVEFTVKVDELALIWAFQYNEIGDKPFIQLSITSPNKRGSTSVNKFATGRNTTPEKVWQAIQKKYRSL